MFHRRSTTVSLETEPLYDPKISQFLDESKVLLVREKSRGPSENLIRLISGYKEGIDVKVGYII